jgi:hypothetical protein
MRRGSTLRRRNPMQARIGALVRLWRGTTGSGRSEVEQLEPIRDSSGRRLRFQRPPPLIPAAAFDSSGRRLRFQRPPP